MSTWRHFMQVVGFSRAPTSRSNLWEDWVKGLGSQHRFSCTLLARAIIWQIWLERTACIFQCASLSVSSIFLKICFMFLSWVDAAPIAKRQKLEETSSAMYLVLRVFPSRRAQLWWLFRGLHQLVCVSCPVHGSTSWLSSSGGFFCFCSPALTTSHGSVCFLVWFHHFVPLLMDLVCCLCCFS